MLIVGASARAAAFSARRAGFDPWTADLFADRDLALAASAYERVQRYPDDFPAISRQGRAGPWMYTGAIENFPWLVERMAETRTLWGNLAQVLRRIRCPFTVGSVLREHNIPCPAVLASDVVPPAGRWLVKPLQGASGRGISFFSMAAPALTSKYYLQEYLEGVPCSAVFVASNADASLLGMTRQLVGESWLHAASFHYCGGIGLLVLPSSQREAVSRLGQVLAGHFGLQGLFGVDFIFKDGVPWPVEINPRYTASVEVLEWTTRVPALAHHAMAFRGCAIAPVFNSAETAQAMLLGKAIYYAAGACTFPQEGPWDDDLHAPFDPWRMPGFADIPWPGQLFAAGQPVLSLFARGTTEQECRENLKRIAGDLDHRLSPR